MPPWGAIWVDLGHAWSAFRRGTGTHERTGKPRSAALRSAVSAFRRAPVYSRDLHRGGPRCRHCFPPRSSTARNDALRGARSPREIVRWALEESGLDRIAIASAFQAEGTVRDAHGHADPPGHPDPVPGDGLPVRRDARVQGAAHRAARPERRRPRRRAHGRAAGGVVRRRGSTSATRSGAARSTRCGRCSRRCAASTRGSRPSGATPRRPGRRAPFVEQYELEPGRMIVKINPVAAWTRSDTWAYLRGARPAAQPAVRPRLRVDRMRAVHADAVRGRAGARGPLGRAVEVGVRDPAARGGRRPARGASTLALGPRPRPRAPRGASSISRRGARRASRRPPAPGTAPAAVTRTWDASCT